MELSDFSGELKRLVEEIKQHCMIKKYKKINSVRTFKNLLIDGIVDIATNNGLLVIRNEVVDLVSEETIDVAIYQENGTCLFAINFTGWRLKESFKDLNSFQALNKIVITYIEDTVYIKNLVKLFNTKKDIQILQIPNLRFYKGPKEQRLKNVEIWGDSPYELKLKEHLKLNGIQFHTQVPVYETNRYGIPKYWLDFVVIGRFSKLVVECDGLRFHLTKKGMLHDTIRDLWVTQNTDYNEILRFNTDEITTDIDLVIQKIKQSLHKWDSYHEKQNEKSKKPSKVFPIDKEKVALVLKDIKHSISRAVSESVKRREKGNYIRRDRIVHYFNKNILDMGYSNEIAYLYFDIPYLSKYTGTIDSFIMGYGTAFSIFYLETNVINIPIELLEDKRIVKVIISTCGDIQKVQGENYIILTRQGVIVKSDIFTDIVSKVNYKEDISPTQTIMDKQQTSVKSNTNIRAKEIGVKPTKRTRQNRTSVYKRSSSLDKLNHMHIKDIESTLRDMYTIKTGKDTTLYEITLREKYRRLYQQKKIKSSKIVLFNGISKERSKQIREDIERFWKVITLEGNDVSEIDSFNLAIQYMKQHYKRYAPLPITIHDVSILLNKCKVEKKFD